MIRLICIVATISLPACMSSTSLQVLKPADITLPDHIQKIAVANRSLPSKKNAFGNVIEGLLTGERLFMDREGSADCVFGLADVLTQTPRFDVTRAINLDLRGTGTSVFPSPLSWKEVAQICEDNNADALAVLEVFDSDSHLDFAIQENKVKNKAGGYTIVIEHIADMRMRVTAGWRIYDPANKLIIDEFKSEDHQNFAGKGKNREPAEANLPQKRKAVSETGLFAGKQYGYRIAPMWVRVSRSYYSRGNDDLKKAARMARVNNWKGAVEIWKYMVEMSFDYKLAGRAAYNMALACEIEGKLQLARTWARKSYEEFNIKTGMTYARTLERRIADNERLKEQIGE